MHVVCYRYATVCLSICHFKDILVIFSFRCLNKVAMNIHTRCVDTRFHFSQVSFRSEMAKFHGKCSLTFKVFCQVAARFCIPTGNV